MKYNSDLLATCDIFNRHNVKYLIIGGHACALHGHVRATVDIDILLKNDNENLENALSAVSELLPDITEKLTPSDIRDNIVLKIIDQIELDLSIQAWSLDYEEGTRDMKTMIIDGIIIPYPGIDELIKSKNTQREIDQWDIKILTEIKKNRIMKG